MSFPPFLPIIFFFMVLFITVFSSSSHIKECSIADLELLVNVLSLVSKYHQQLLAAETESDVPIRDVPIRDVPIYWKNSKTNAAMQIPEEPNQIFVDSQRPTPVSFSLPTCFDFTAGFVLLSDLYCFPIEKLMIEKSRYHERSNDNDYKECKVFFGMINLDVVAYIAPQSFVLLRGLEVLNELVRQSKPVAEVKKMRERNPFIVIFIKAIRKNGIVKYVKFSPVEQPVDQAEDMQSDKVLMAYKQTPSKVYTVQCFRCYKSSAFNSAVDDVVDMAIRDEIPVELMYKPIKSKSIWRSMQTWKRKEELLNDKKIIQFRKMINKYNIKLYPDKVFIFPSDACERQETKLLLVSFKKSGEDGDRHSEPSVKPLKARFYFRGSCTGAKQQIAHFFIDFIIEDERLTELPKVFKDSYWISFLKHGIEVTEEGNGLVIQF